MVVKFVHTMVYSCFGLYSLFSRICIKASIFHDHLSKKITDEKKEIKILIRIVYSSVYNIARIGSERFITH